MEPLSKTDEAKANCAEGRNSRRPLHHYLSDKRIIAIIRVQRR